MISNTDTKKIYSAHSAERNRTC